MLALTFCLMVGTAGLPHILMRYYTVPSVKDARISVGWSLFFIFLLYFTAPAYAAFARNEVLSNIIGLPIAQLPAWMANWGKVGLVSFKDINADGILQFYELTIGADAIVLAMPEIAGLPYVISGLVAAGGLAAALSTADGLLLTISNALSHDLYYKMIDPHASITRRLTISRILLVVTALISAYVATFKLTIIVELVAWAFSIAAASFFPALVMGIWDKRANKAGALAGMWVGFLSCVIYMIGSRFYGLDIWGIRTISSGPLRYSARVHRDLRCFAHDRAAEPGTAGLRRERPHSARRCEGSRRVRLSFKNIVVQAVPQKRGCLLSLSDTKRQIDLEPTKHTKTRKGILD